METGDIKQELQYYKNMSEELGLILDMGFDQITVCDGDGIYIRVSRHCEESFGISSQEILGLSAYDLVEKGVFDRSVAVEVLRNKRETTIFQHTRNGRKLLVTGKPVFSKDGKITKIVNILRDVTELESLKKELQEREILMEEMRRQLKNQKAQNEENKILYGTSPQVTQVVRLMEHVAPLNVTVLLQGETGVGKSVFAKRIHQLGTNREEPFIQINCGAIPAELLESELFGYVPGAFTGASKNGKNGLFVSAGKGTIFLDEISELPLPLQVKLLQALQERIVYKIGSTVPNQIHARIIAASNKNLEEQVKKGLFREDLYYRVSVVPIKIPPLRERREDIAMFACYFLNQANEKYGIHREMEADALRLLERYPWPGNVRQLENTMERLVVTTMEPEIQCKQIQAVLGEREEELPLSQEQSGKSLAEIMEQVESQVLARHRQSGKTTREIAAELGIDQSTVVKKLKKYQIK